MRKSLKFPPAVASAVGVGGLFILWLTVLTLVLAAISRQIPRLTELIPLAAQAVEQGENQLRGWLLSVAQAFPENLEMVLSRWAENLFTGEDLLTPFLQGIPRFATELVGKLSRGAFGLLTGLIASFMLSVRLPQIRLWLGEYLPETVQRRWGSAVKGLRQALGGWLLAQGKLMAMTFGILTGGFLLLRVKNPFVWAGLTALVDAFPILGVGTVLLPWAAVCLVQGDMGRGLGLLGLYAAAWLLRQVAEPRLVGKELGLDPLVTLMAIYAGFQLSGIWGMLLAPFVAMTIWQVWRSLMPKL